MLSKLSLIVLFTSGIATAAEPVQQLSCNISRDLSGWTASTSVSYTTENKQFPVSEAVPVGEVLMYLSMKDAKKTYQSNDEVLLNDRSPLSPNTKIAAGEEISIIGALISKERGDIFDLISTKGNAFSQKIFPVKDDGFICADQIGFGTDRKMSIVGMPVVSQAGPLMSKIQPDPNGKTRSLAVTLQKLEGATAVVQVAWMVNGRPNRILTKSFDVFGGLIDLNGLMLKVRKSGQSLIIESINEPSNYYVWAKSFFDV